MQSLLKTRSTQFALYATIYTAIVLAVLATMNFLANRHNFSLDTTATKRYSLSDQTEKLVKNLKQDVTVSYFDRPSAFQGARDLLSRYENLSPKFKVKYIDYAKEPLLTRSMGVRTAGTTIIESGAKRDEAKSVTEEELTSALIRVLKEGDRSVCFTKGLGEHTPEDDYSAAKQVAERSTYKVRSINLLDKPEVPADCTVIVAAGPRREYPAVVAQAIQKFVEAGGKALVMIDPPIKGIKDDVAENPELLKVLASWGITSDPEIVLDASGAGRFFGAGPEMPLIASYEQHPIVRDMKETASAMPLARPLKVGGPVGKATAEKLFSTLPKTYAKPAEALKGEIAIDPSKDKNGPFVLGAAGTYNTGDPKKQGRFAVYGSSNFASNSYIRFGGNSDLFGNTLNWLAADEDLISIRPKDPEDRRIQATRGQMNMFFWVSVILLPIGVIAAGVGVWWRRR